MTEPASAYLRRPLRTLAQAQADIADYTASLAAVREGARHPVGVGRCERCIWRRVVCTNAKSPLRDKIVAPRDGCLAFEEGW